MRALILCAVLLATSIPIGAGCIIDNRPRRGRTYREAPRSCPPAYHWNGNRCVHNGRGHGKHKHKRR